MSICKSVVSAALLAICPVTFAESYSASSYSTNGLIGHWDAIENAGVGVHDASVTHWCDLSGQTGDFIVKPSVAQFTDNGLYKAGAGVMATNVVPRPRSARSRS